MYIAWNQYLEANKERKDARHAQYAAKSHIEEKQVSGRVSDHMTAF